MSDNYEPYGAEWEAEVMKATKRVLVGMLKANCQKLADAKAEMGEWVQASGLLSTLHPTMEVDIDNPVAMAERVERFVRRQLADAKAVIDRLTVEVHQRGYFLPANYV